MWRACACSVSAIQHISHVPQRAVACHFLSDSLAAPSSLVIRQTRQPFQPPQLAGTASEAQQQPPGLLLLWHAILHSSPASPCNNQRHRLILHDRACMSHQSSGRGYRTKINRRQIPADAADEDDNSSRGGAHAQLRFAYRQLLRDPDQEMGDPILHQQQKTQQRMTPQSRQRGKQRRQWEAPDSDSEAQEAARPLGHKQQSGRKRQWQCSSFEDETIHWQPQAGHQSQQQQWRQQPDSGTRKQRDWGWQAQQETHSRIQQQQRSSRWDRAGTQEVSASQSAAAVTEQSSSDSGKQRTATPAAAADSKALDPAALTKTIGRARSLPELQKLLQDHKDQLQQINVCAAFKAVVRLATKTNSSDSSSTSSVSEVGRAASSNRPDAAALAIMRQLSSRMQSQIRTARPWDLAQAAWACSKLQYREQALLNAIAQQTIRKAPILLPQDIAQLASAYSRLQYPHKQLLQLLQQQTLVKADGFEAWSLVHTAWSLEMAGAATNYMLELLTAIAQQLGPQQIKKLQPLDVSTLVWLMASHQYYNHQLLEALGQQLPAQIAHYPPAAVAQVLCSVAGLGYYDPDLAAAAAAVVQQQLVDQLYSPKQVSQTSFALAKLGHASPELLDTAAAAFVGSSAGRYSPGLLCMMCWAALLGGYRSEKFTEKLVQESYSQLPQFTADQMASIMRGMFRMPGWSENPRIMQLLSAAAAQLPQQLPDMAVSVLEKLIVALSKQHHILQRFVPPQQQQQEEEDQQFAASADLVAVGSGSVESERDQQQQQQMELRVLLQQCGQEWLPRQQQHSSTVTKKQVYDVKAALAAAGLTELAAAIEQAQSNSLELYQQEGSSADLQDTSAADSEHLRVPAAAAAAAAQQGSWLDSFVANEGDK